MAIAVSGALLLSRCGCGHEPWGLARVEVEANALTRCVVVVAMGVDGGSRPSDPPLPIQPVVGLTKWSPSIRPHMPVGVTGRHSGSAATVEAPSESRTTRESVERMASLRQPGGAAETRLLVHL